jgi:hypothetical protein
MIESYDSYFCNPFIFVSCFNLETLKLNLKSSNSFNLSYIKFFYFSMLAYYD